jgi:hypothetical protein
MTASFFWQISSGGVVGVAEQEHARFAATSVEGFFKNVPVDGVTYPAVLGCFDERRFLADDALVLLDVVEGHVNRRLDQVAIARGAQGRCGGIKPADQAGHRDDAGFIHIPIVELFHSRGHRLAQGLSGYFVAKDAVVDGGVQGGGNGFRNGEVHIGHPHG